MRTLLNASNPRMHPYVLAPLVNSSTGALLKFLGDEAAKRRNLPSSAKPPQHGRAREASAVAAKQADSQSARPREAPPSHKRLSHGRERGPAAASASSTSAVAESVIRPRVWVRRAAGKDKVDEL